MPAPVKSIMVAPQVGKTSTRCSSWQSRWRNRRRRREIIIAQVVIPDRFVTGVGRDLEQADNIEEELAERPKLWSRVGPQLESSPSTRFCLDRTTCVSPRKRRST